MKTTSKSLNSYIKKRKIEIKKWNMETTGKYELPSATPMYTSLQDCCV